MFRWILSLIPVSILVFAFPVFAANDSIDIIGGVEVGADDPDAASTVAILSRTPEGIGLCSASLLASDILITAAHCVTGIYGEATSPNNLRVAFGKNLHSDDIIVRRVVGSKAHPTWKGLATRGKDQGDIAIVRFRDGLPPGYRQAKVLAAHVNLKPGGTTLLMGFGVDRMGPNGGSGVGILRKVDAQIDEPKFGRTEVLLDQRNGKGACYGDSGGPAFIRNSSGEPLLWGVTNRANPDDSRDCRQGSIYTRITAHAAFVDAAIKQLRRVSNN